MENELFIKKITLRMDEVESFDEYPFNIPVLKDFRQLEFTSPVTFLIGENGTGKSTLVEALALALGINGEGGSQNITFSTRDTTSELYKYLTVSRMGRPKTRFFLRAESFYNFSTAVSQQDLEEYYGGDLHSVSHGESFLQLVNERFYDHGLYILDEPEAGLSPLRQMTLLCDIHQLAEEGSQFIIATHSPILISYYKGRILDLNNSFAETDYRDTEIYRFYRMYLDNPEAMQHRLFERKPED